MNIVVVGANGTLGKRIVGHLGAAPLELRAGADPDATEPSLSRADVVINLSGPRVRAQLVAEDYLREHVEIAARVVRSMRAGSHLVHVSSTAVYGARGGVLHAGSAEAPSRFPMPAYAHAKLAAEMCVRALCPSRDVALTVLRPSMVYGPGIDSALGSLAALAARGARIVLGPEDVRQHLLHIALFIAAVERVVESPRGGAPLVLADPFVLTNRDIVPRGGVSIPLPLALVRKVHAAMGLHAPHAIDSLAVLALDNEFDWRTTFDALALEPSRFARGVTFEPYWESLR